MKNLESTSSDGDVNHREFMKTSTVATASFITTAGISEAAPFPEPEETIREISIELNPKFLDAMQAEHGMSPDDIAAEIERRIES